MKSPLGDNGLILPLPPSAVEFLDETFQELNDVVAKSLQHHGNVNEASLDQDILTTLRERSPSEEFPSGHSISIEGFAADDIDDLASEISIEVHNVASGHHVEQREVADLGVVITYSLGGNTIRQKLCLLQSKRLYPDRVSGSSTQLPSGVTDPLLRFNSQSRYQALKMGSQQFQDIETFEDEFGVEVFYLLHNPPTYPTYVKPETTVPLSGAKPLGCRILPARALHAITGVRDGQQVSLKHVLNINKSPFRGSKNRGGWRFSDFITSRLLHCRAGAVYYDRRTGTVDGKADAVLRDVFNRTLPLNGAIRLKISYSD